MQSLHKSIFELLAATEMMNETWHNFLFRKKQGGYIITLDPAKSINYCTSTLIHIILKIEINEPTRASDIFPLK